MTRGSTDNVAGRPSHSPARLWAALGATLTLFLGWAAIAAHPWAPVQPAKPDSRLAALQARQQRLNRAAGLTDQIVNRRWATYRAQLTARQQEIAAGASRHRQELAAAAAAAATIALHRREREAEAAQESRAAAAAELVSRPVAPARRVAPVEAAPVPAPPRPAPEVRVAGPAPVVATRPAPVVAPVAAVQPPPRVEIVTLPPVTSTHTS